MRCGGNWRRDYGDSQTGTKGETPETAKELSTDYRASSRPYRGSILIGPVEDYAPDVSASIAFDLAAIREPDDAVAFAEKYGRRVPPVG